MKAVLSVFKNTLLGSGRTNRLLQQFTYSFIARGLSMLFGMIFVRYSISAFGKEAYGTFVAISSATAFLNLSEGGVGAGIRNKLTEALGRNDNEAARLLISSSYFQLFLILAPLMVVMLVLNYALPWPSWLNLIQQNKDQELRLVMGITVVGVFCSLWLGLVNSVAAAKGMQSLQSVATAFGAFLSCALVLALGWAPPSFSTISVLAFITLAAPIFSQVLSSLWLYGQNKLLCPSVRHISFHLAREILGFGGKVFLINITDYFLFTASTIMISSLYGASVVAELAVGQRIFVILQTIFGMLAFASGTSLIQARIDGDWKWISRYVRKVQSFLVFISIATIIVAAFMPAIVRLWIGSEITISMPLLWMQCLVAIVSYWNTFFRTVLISFNRLRVIIYCGGIGVFVNLSCFFFLGAKFGPAGTLFAVFLGLIPSIFLLPFELRNQLYSFSGKDE